MGTSAIEKIYPGVEELSSVCSTVKCPQDKCTSIFHSTSNLNMHLIKHHKVANSGLTPKQLETQYFCPVSFCIYHKDSKKHFTKLKYLKQHFLKVHASKEFVCNKCGKKFSTDSFKALHMKHCGKLFNCTCGSYYTSPEAILTHCKRKGKGHSLVEKSEKEKESVIHDVLQESEHNKVKKPERFIYPKLSNDMSFPIHYIAAVALSELSVPQNLSKVVDKGIQTEIGDFIWNKDYKSNCTPMKLEKKRKNSQQTQTSGKFKKMKISTQTQTNSDYLKQKVKSHPRPILRKRKKSMETQTKEHLKINYNHVGNQLRGTIKERFKSNTPSSGNFKYPKKANDKLNLFDSKGKIEDVTLDEDKERKWLWDNQLFIQKEVSSTSVDNKAKVKNELFNISSELNLCQKDIDLNGYSGPPKNNVSASEQGSDGQMFDLNRLCNIETQTEIDALLTEYNEDTNFTLCSTTETQTTDDFDCLLYSNMCTQTCEEVDQLFNFNIVHIETQTTWPDLNDCPNLDS